MSTMGSPKLQLALILIASLLIGASIFFQGMKKHNQAMIFLVVGAFLLFLFATVLDPFLNLWDERFHALVAKNLMSHPFKPMLYADPILDIPYDRWDRAHIWLNKQPFFLWPAALLFHILGVNEFALRLPGALAGSILVLLAYRTGRLLISERTGYYAAFLIATAFYMVEIISGRQELEHNDMAFLLWVSASIWAWMEYLRSGKRKWIALISMFSGLAVLVKWLVGLLVYLAWVVYITGTQNHRRREFLKLILSALIAIAIALVWYLYIFFTFPDETMVTLQLYADHLTRSLDGHAGTFWFHLNHMPLLYGTIASVAILPACWVLYRRIVPKSLSVSLIVTILFVYLFFSVAKTKMPSLPWVVSLPIYLALGCLMDYIVSWISAFKAPKILVSGGIMILTMGIGSMNLKVPEIMRLHSDDPAKNNLLANLYHNKAIFLELPKELPDNSVIFNIKGRHYIECMFYSGFPSYSVIPTERQMMRLKTLGKNAVVFSNQDEPLPGYLVSDPGVTIIRKSLQGWE